MSISRKLILTIAGNKVVTSFVNKYGMKWGATRFVAGDTLSSAIETVKRLNDDGLEVTLDHLGESVASKEEATHATLEAINIYDAIDKANVRSNVSVKLTQLGLDIDKDLCLENMDKIARKAKELKNFVRIDMEDSLRTEVTLEIFHKLFETYGREHIGTVIQSYLYRSNRDMEKLAEINSNVRVVKGAYREPETVAYKQKKEVDFNFMKLCQDHLTRNCYTAIATHDEIIINFLKTWIQENKIPKDLYEFQMLYGVRNKLQRELVREGYRVRVYTPYGKDWYPYFTRRIAERPANAWFILKNLFRG